MALTSKFKKDLQTLKGAANREIFLDVKNPKLYKKEGVIEFTGDPLEDYDMIMDCLVEDLHTSEVQ